MVKIYLHKLGSNVAVGITGAKKDIKETYYSFWNWKGTSGGLTYFNDNFGYFLSTKDKIDLYCKNWAWNQVEDKYPNLSEKEKQDRIDTLAEGRYSSFIKSTFLNSNDNPVPISQD